ncbi:MULTISPECIES: acyl-CoA dehydrogenase family protein [unclassified Amycolatopsis]|uniref:acyl-CoA dehydrogenase family protein n=1 Tax=unclassified Amycolatopsis TaxID=2618356 RepID=UPI002874D22C|nr:MULTISPECIES: acyl-CoA dehydrogenase family protein [unclassified Amycolatopsis]MDS0138837.1 acyl-CoA dehydrogenase family protein [Amycolatopsis sp. 505]MDS0147331.1 acyl-CoA dehydrogenase family protein [Amycolatopsis sp. CM201R]
MTDPLETEEARALRDAVRALLTRRSGPEAVRAAMASPLGYDDKLWSTLCEQIGVAALTIPERYGGAGAGLAEACVVLAELGRTLTPAPMLGSAVLAAQALLLTGNDEACERLLPGIAEGTTLAAVAWSDVDGGWTPALRASDAGLDGRTHYVLDGDLADVLLAIARTDDGAGLFEVPLEGVRRTRVTSLDPTRRLAVVECASTPARRLDAGGFAGQLRQLRDTATVAVAAEQVGAAARALELTVEYTKQRRQFGRPIGSFQALKHRMADVHVHVEAARSALYAALVDGDAEAVETAKVVCGEAFAHAAAEMIQLHGGIAITWEHDAHLYFKRAHGTALLFGAPGSERRE